MPDQQISNYRFVERIGAGGMGAVFKAEDVLLGKPVAIKVMQPSHSDVQAATKRFLNECRAISSVDHPNIVRLHHIIEDAGSYYMVMQYVDGTSLRKVLSARTPSLEEVLRVACEAASALEHAHARGIIHRDLKPDNIMITREGVTKILDFGVAHLVDYTSITSSGVFVGTLAYAAPEQIHRRRPIDGRVDVYGLGVVLFEMLTGRLPFDQGDATAPR
jgi:serine/threonine-protein kinase